MGFIWLANTRLDLPVLNDHSDIVLEILHVPVSENGVGRFFPLRPVKIVNRETLGMEHFLKVLEKSAKEIKDFLTLPEIVWDEILPPHNHLSSYNYPYNFASLDQNTLWWNHVVYRFEYESLFIEFDDTETAAQKRFLTSSIVMGYKNKIHVDTTTYEIFQEWRLKIIDDRSRLEQEWILMEKEDIPVFETLVISKSESTGGAMMQIQEEDKMDKVNRLALSNYTLYDSDSTLTDDDDPNEKFLSDSLPETLQRDHDSRG
jgi:hypothetical protein